LIKPKKEYLKTTVTIISCMFNHRLIRRKKSIIKGSQQMRRMKAGLHRRKRKTGFRNIKEASGLT